MHSIHHVYDTQTDSAIPLILLNKSEWEEISLSSTLTALEKRYFQHQRFKANVGDLCLIYNPDGNIIKVYLGTAEGNEQARVAAMAVASSHLPSGSYLPAADLSTNAKIAWGSGQYQFKVYKKDHKECSEMNEVKGLKTNSSWRGSETAKLCVSVTEATSLFHDLKSIFRVRDLINMPPNDLNPETLSKILQTLASEHHAAFEEILGDDLLTENFPAIHAVGRASVYAPRLLSLTWGETHHPLVSLVGKGVCFDSGGLDIKPSSAMRFMKKDMGGAAHIISLAEWIMATHLPIRLRVFIPAVENAIGPNAFRPGDILTMRNGLTVEVDNTDAEGRLVLADAMVRACEESPDLLVDFATLTGAARVAVGTELSAMFCNQDSLAQALIHASENMNDPVWRLPLFKNYQRLLKSSVADLSNCSSAPYGGAITAALFLEHFVADSVPWAHFDIMAWNLSAQPGKPEGGEAMGLRAVADYLRRTYSKADHYC